MKAPALLALVALLGACDSRPDDTLFRLRSSDHTGIRFANVLQEDDSVYNPLDYDYLYNGAGVALGDFNDDGLLDVYFTGNMVSSRLYLNRGELRFEDVTDAAGVGTAVWATGVTTVDIDDDGLLDLYVSVAGLAPEAERGNLLFVNRGVDESGVPRFEERAAEYGIDDRGYSTQGAFFDYDRDGDLDLYVLTNALEENNRNQIRPKRVAGQAKSTDRLYRNDGDGTFTNVSREAGILIEGYGLGVGISDLDQDGWPDVYVANDFLSNDLVWVNNGDGTFTNHAADYLTHMTHNGMGMDIADYDNDGRVDIAVLDMLPPDNHRQKMMLMAGNYDKFHMGLDLGYEPQYMRNTLQRNMGPGPDGAPRFSEIGQLAGVHQTDWSWAPLFADFDNDGYKDLFISNGYRRDVTNLDFIVYLREDARLHDREERARMLLERLQELPEVKLPNYAFRNRGDLTFDDVSREWGVAIPSYSNGTAYGDLDNDGDLDLVVNNLDQEAFVLENRAVQDQAGGFLRVMLAGPAGNRAGYGARVTLQAGGERQVVEAQPVRGYKSSVDPALHFGLGDTPTVDWVEVRWPDGSVERITDVAANATIRFDRAAARPDAAAPAESEGREARPLFRAAAGVDYEHVEREVVDFQVTPMLPHKFSLGGPGLAVGDLDGDGRDDVFIGADRGQTASIHFQTAPGTFRPVPLADDEPYEDMGALIFDADGDGDRDLYVVSGGNFALTAPSRYRDRLYVNDGRGGLTREPEALPSLDASGSVVTAADFDADGDLDLFVGGRIVPGEYPLPPRSYLLRNDSRPGAPRFTDITEEMAPGLARVGLVSAGIWSDYDGDGLTDLLLAGEWMDLTVFRNTGQGLVDATAEAGLDGTAGWWNSLVAGDFDSDGDTDYVAGNLGLNTMFRASPDEPMRVHAADFDGNGSVDPVLSRYIDGRSYPIASRDLLVDQMIAMKGRFGHYIEYADATLEQTLSETEREQALVRTAVRLESSYLENRGDGTFTVRSLPVEAQVAPVFGLLARDFDGDGNLDVLGVGNTTAPQVQIGQFVASYGTLLLGDGAGGFRTAGGAASGFFTEGEGRGLAELAVDETRSVVLVTRNDDAVQTFLPLAVDGVACVTLRPLETHALITFEDGRTRRQEVPWGSGYLSQSSRILKVPANAERVVIYDSRGGSRTLAF